MKPMGKTCLIKAEIKKEPQLINGIYIAATNDEMNDIFYQGKIIAYGNGYTDEEIKNLVPIGKTVIFDYKEKRGTKLIFGKNVYYIKYEDQLLGVIEDE